MGTNSLSAAAAHLGVSQPSVSIAIKRLEDQLGIALFDRISGRLVPTEEARLIFREVDRVHQQSEMLSEMVYSIARGDTSVFRFGATPSLGMRLIPKALKQLQRERVAGTYYADSLSQRDMRDYLLFGRGSCVATIAEVNDPVIDTVKFAETGLVCIVPADHPLARQSVVRPQDLDRETLISFAPMTTHGLLIDETFKQANAVRKTAIYVHFVEAALAFVTERIGITILDGFSALGCGIQGLVAIPIAESVTVSAYVHAYRLRPRPAGVDSLVRALRNAITDAATNNPEGMVSTWIDQ